MAAFEYKALDGKGRNKKGVIEADNARQARQQLREQGLVPVDVQQGREKAIAQQSSKSAVRFQRGISTNELSLVTRQLATLVQAGMPLEECLKAVAEQSEKIRIRNMILSIRSRVVEGYTLADSLRDYPGSFDELYCAMVAAGEKSGHLDSILNRLADYVENRQKNRSKVVQAMVYPVVLVVVAIAIVSILLAFVVPPIIEQFLQSGQALPPLTELLLAMSEFVQNWGAILLVVGLVAFMLFRFWLRVPKNRLRWDKTTLSVPVLGKVTRGLNTSRFARTLAICASSAIPLLDGMKVASDVMTNRYVKQKIEEAADKVREGSSLRLALDQSKLFPPMMLHMIASGERSGELESMLVRAADNQDQQFDATVNMAIGILTPAMIILMAGMVSFIVFATLMPIIEMNNMVGF
ncbi:type II secretion system inner membrane protein GspF [Thaumasiovibrio subtropicus]|uniref:type II secretion system inner membrane protein GspF n=1 Tax=Thaumasiovibrio subtropicus TaxID=1891207 RepID=UPI000B34AC2A|nr:type II secretion system inner membrane protein GspF [Thaumasiovibrio subtropicus]